MNCEALLERLGFECKLVSDSAIAVTTPFVFADGEPIRFYLEEFPHALGLTDNGHTLLHLSGIGWEVRDGRAMTSIRRAVSSFGLELNERGEIYCELEKDQQPTHFARYVSAMLAVVDLEKEFLGLTEEQSQYIAEVEFYLRAWKPNAPFILLPSLKGHSGRTHAFHFDLDGTLIDAARPHGTRTGSIVRKALDIQNQGLPQKIMVVMDDREDPERAKAETDILTTLVSVMSFSNLVEQAGGSRSAS